MALATNTAEAATVSNRTHSAEHDQANLKQLPSVSPPPLEDLGSQLPACRMDHALTKGYYVRGPSFASVYWDRRGDAKATGDSDIGKYRVDAVEGGPDPTIGNGGIRGGNDSSSHIGSGGSSDRVDDDFYSSGCRIDIGPPVPNYREPQFAWIGLTNYVDWQAAIEREAELERRPQQPRCRVFITHQPIGAERLETAAAGVVELPRQSSLLPPPFIWAMVTSRLLLLGRSCDGRGGADSGGGRFRRPRGLQVSLGLLRGLSACHVARLGTPATLDHRWAALIAQDPRYDALLLPHHQPCLDGVNYTLSVEAAESRARQIVDEHGVDYIDYADDYGGKRLYELDVQATVVPHESSCRRLCMDGRCSVAAGMQIRAQTSAPDSVTIRYEALSPMASGCDPEAFVGFVIRVRTHSRIVVVT